MLTFPEWFCAWSTLAVTKLRGKNDGKANGVQLPAGAVLPPKLLTGDATGPLCGEELDADGPVLLLGLCSSGPSRGLQSSKQDFKEGRLAALAGVSGASSKVALINEHMCSEESYSIPLKLLTWSRFWRQPYSAH